jgi:hypothetical protein
MIGVIGLRILGRSRGGTGEQQIDLSLQLFLGQFRHRELRAFA